jgi:hypothetical protein
MKAAAIKKGHTFRCDQCGESYSIVYSPSLADRWVAERQAHWLEKVLAEESVRRKIPT